MATYGVIFFLLGAIFGSFLNVVVLRLPAGKKISGRSRCNICHKVLGLWDLIPILSFLILKGQCRYCKTKISPRYLLMEILTGLLFLFTWFALQPSHLSSIIYLAAALISVSVFLVVFVIDLEHYIILDSIIYFSSGLLFCLNLISGVTQKNLFVLQGRFISGLIGAALGFLLFFSLWYFSRGRWMGFGDVKFMIFFGLSLSFPLNILGILLAFFLGAVFSIPLLIFGKKNLQSRLPFGTFLSVAGIASLLYGERLFGWYLKLLGIYPHYPNFWPWFGL